MGTLDHIIKKYNPVKKTRSMMEIRGNRYDFFPEIIRDLQFTMGAEIGVERGVFSEYLLTDNKQFLLYGIDPWKAYHGYREHVSQDKLDGFYEETLSRLKYYNFSAFREFSVKASEMFGDETLDFLYIDGNHRFLNVVEDLHYWSPKVKPGGIIAGHDFRRNSKKYINDVKDVIPAWAYAHRIKPWFVLREHHEASSWFWVKGVE